MNVQEQIPLAPLTTLGVGGAARYFMEASTAEDVVEAVRFARDRGLPLFVLGGGSNLVVADAGFDGLVVKIALRGVERCDVGGGAIFRVAAGEDWDGFVARTVEEECAGVECLSGIPGTVGGTPVQNVGAYGQEVAETIVEVAALDRQSRQVRTFANDECGFGYRTSRFNSADRERYIILNVTYRLRRGGAPTPRYADLKKAFADGAREPSLLEVRRVVREIRRSKAMLLVEGDEDARSAGSFFKNPVVTQRMYDELEERLRMRGLAMPSYPAGEGLRKLSAAWLVEHAGFAKGYARGAAGISRKHVLAIVNRGGAKAAEIIELRDEIQTRVQADFGIELTPEPVFVGF
ncbi:MAG TPA: UDP-N-acetylmuramate dehydrogenase [Candidatus Angelobacter sp.]|nr:UDP-N-acetylmuramate dehydrogenase [Candidatus Angelobacter sp.]